MTQADTQPCVNTEKAMSRQDNLASQERVVVNGRHCVDKLFVSELEEGHANQSSHANQSNQSNHEA